MVNRFAIFSHIATVSLLLGVTLGGAAAQENHQGMTHATGEQTHFQRVNQPLWVKAAVTAGGVGLIGLEWWWFLLSKPKSRQATSRIWVDEGKGNEGK
jgi:plastocyanin domain-containing protein